MRFNMRQHEPIPESVSYVIKIHGSAQPMKDKIPNFPSWFHNHLAEWSNSMESPRPRSQCHHSIQLPHDPESGSLLPRLVSSSVSRSTFSRLRDPSSRKPSATSSPMSPFMRSTESDAGPTVLSGKISCVPPATSRASASLPAHSPNRQEDPNRRRRYLYIHRCPVCQAEQIARRAVRRWRCAACVEAGLDGELEIWRRPLRSTKSR